MRKVAYERCCTGLRIGIVFDDTHDDIIVK